MNATDNTASTCPYCHQSVTEADIQRGFCPNCEGFLLCAHCRHPVTRADKERETCPHCGARLISSAREAELDEIRAAYERQLRKMRQAFARERAAADRAALARRQARLLAITDEEWQAAVEADKGRDPNPAQKALAESGKQEKTERRRAEVIDMTCPLCGHNKVKRYPYRSNGWQYVCQGCKRAFNPELWAAN